DKEDLAAGKYQLYEEKMNELAQGFQQCHKMFPGVIAGGQREQTDRISDNNQETEIKETPILSRKQKRKLKKKLEISQYYRTKSGRSTVDDEKIRELVKQLNNLTNIKFLRDN
ncbi:10534_t:CDS:2, partial [Racocetra persica]